MWSSRSLRYLNTAKRVRRLSHTAEILASGEGIRGRWGVGAPSMVRVFSLCFSLIDFVLKLSVLYGWGYREGPSCRTRDESVLQMRSLDFAAMIGCN